MNNAGDDEHCLGEEFNHRFPAPSLHAEGESKYLYAEGEESKYLDAEGEE